MESVQLSLFERPSFNVSGLVKAAMSKAAKGCGLSRDQIVDRMNALGDRYGVSLAKGTSKKLTIETLEKWLNPADITRCIPIKALPVFCAAVNNISTLDIMAQPLGCRVIGEREQKLLKWAEAYHDARDARERMKKIEQDIKA